MRNAAQTPEPTTCAACGRANRPFANFCGFCGDRLPGRMVCAQCGEESVPGARFCHMCGVPLAHARPQQGPEQQSGGRPERTEAPETAPPAPPPLLTTWLQKIAALAGPPAAEEPAAIHANLYAAILAIAVAIGAQSLLGLGWTVPALCLYAAAIALAVRAFRLNPDAAPTAASPGTASPETAQQLPAKWLAPLLLLPLLPALLSLTRLLTDPMHPPASFWLLHVAAILLFIACVYYADRRLAPAAARSPARPHADHKPWSTWERLAAIAILCAGLLLRLHDLPALPFGAWHGEADVALQAQRLLQEPAYRPLFSDIVHAPAHYIYLVSSLFLLLPDVTFVIRFASLLLGTLSIPAAFIAGNLLFGRGPALILACLVALSRWSFNFSRIGVSAIPVTLFTFLGAALLLRALRRNRLTDYLWAGLLLGFGFNVYLSFTLFLIVLSLFLLRRFIANSGLLRQQWQGLLVAAMGLLLFLAPLALFALEEPGTFLWRTRAESIFNEYPPGQVTDGLLENAAAHLLMFNLRGDPNGRHNLPGEPMLAPVAAALFVLGLGISLARFRRPRSILLIAWLLVMMVGGIFALSFQAPHSLRALGALPAAYLLATLPLAHLWQNWRAAAAAPLAPKGLLEKLQPALVRPGPLPFVCLLLFAVALHNYRTYFVDQRNSFAVWNAYAPGESIAAALIAEHAGNADTDIFLTSNFAHHSTVRFLGAAESAYQSLDYAAALPMPLSPDRNALFLLDPGRGSFIEQARGFYPNGELIEHKPPFEGPTVLYELRLRPADVASIQGINVAYFEGEEWAGPPLQVEKHDAVSVDWPGAAPLPAPFSAEWNGVLNIEKYGLHKLILRAPAFAELYIDEELAARVGEEAGPPPAEENGEMPDALQLAQGLHKLRLRAVGGHGPVTLSWQRPGEEEQPVPPAALYVPPVASNGLLGRYYANESWEGPPAFTRIDPQINFQLHDVPLPLPYTVEWQGKLVVPYTGVFRLAIESIDESELWIDGQTVAASAGPEQFDEGAVALAAGLHDIRIRYAARTSYHHLNLYWSQSDQGLMLVHAGALIPPRGNYDHLSAADFATFDRPPPPTPAILPPNITPLPEDAPQTARFELVSGAFERPRGVTAANGRLYVADPARRSLFVLDPDGNEIARIRRSDRRFSDPVDVAAGADGSIYLLDAGNGGRVSVHDAAGGFVRMVPVPDGVLENSRGLDVDAHGRIWVAVTPALAVAAFDADGRELARISTVLPGGDYQPVDVAFHAADAIYVSTVSDAALIRFSRSGQPLNLWPLTAANSLDAPHLALDREGAVYVTQPELSGFLRIPAHEEERIELWALPAAEPIRKLVGIGVGADGELLLTDSAYGRIYRVPLSP